MDIRQALKGQYHAAFRMLRQCIERCPDELWLQGTNPRTYWRIAYHSVFYGHLYLVQSEADFVPWTKNTDQARELYDEVKEQVVPLTKSEVLEYLEQVVSMIDSTIDHLDLETSESGYSWYKNITKLEHVILSIRHIQGHVGQMSERLMDAGIDTDWISRREGR